MNKSFSLGIRLTRLTIPRSLNSFKGEVFFFSLMVLCAALFWNLRFFHIPNYILGFSTNKRQLFMRLHPLTITWQLTYFCSLKNYHVLTFGSFSLNTNRCRNSASPFTHTWLIGSEVLLRLSHLVMIERLGKRDGLSHCQFCLHVENLILHQVYTTQQPTHQSTPTYDWAKL